MDWALASAILRYCAEAGVPRPPNPRRYPVNPRPLVSLAVLRRYVITDDTALQATLDELVELGHLARAGSFYRIGNLFSE